MPKNTLTFKALLFSQQIPRNNGSNRNILQWHRNKLIKLRRRRQRAKAATRQSRTSESGLRSSLTGTTRFSKRMSSASAIDAPSPLDTLVINFCSTLLNLKTTTFNDSRQILRISSHFTSLSFNRWPTKLILGSFSSTSQRQAGALCQNPRR